MKTYRIKYSITGIGRKVDYVSAKTRWLALQVLNFKTNGIHPHIESIRECGQVPYKVTSRGFGCG